MATNSSSRTECPVCKKKWGKSLWSGSCVCTGDVSLVFVAPGVLTNNRPVDPDPIRTTVKQSKKKKAKTEYEDSISRY